MTTSRRNPELIAADFDGTATRVWDEAVPLQEGYVESLAILTELPAAEVRQSILLFEAEVRKNPHLYGWREGDRISVSAAVDPLILAAETANLVLDKAGLFLDRRSRDRLVKKLFFRQNYEKMLKIFRPGAREFLEHLQGRSAYMVTNSHTDQVRNKILHLGENDDGSQGLTSLAERVHGRANKFGIDDAAMDCVPVSITIPGLDRPIYLRRASYYSVLDQLRKQHEVDWDEVLVIGDILELDGHLPLALGAQFWFMVDERTPMFEVEFVDNHPNGQIIRSLPQALEMLQAA